jgi:pimeloyl-ACP methyl ester carboxylesterase
VCSYYRDQLRAHVLVWEYPGYGSAAGVPSEDSVNANAAAVLHFVQHTLKWPLQRVVLFGQSIGTGPTCYLAAHLNRDLGQHVAAVVLQSPYTSILEVAKKLTGSVVGAVLGTLVSDRWRNDAEIKSIADPILFIHGDRDTLIPPLHSQRLYVLAADNKQKELVLCPEATHNDWEHATDIVAPVNRFLARYLAGGRAADATGPDLKVDPKYFIVPDCHRRATAAVAGSASPPSSSPSSLGRLFAASVSLSRAATGATISSFSSLSSLSSSPAADVGVVDMPAEEEPGSASHDCPAPPPPPPAPAAASCVVAAGDAGLPTARL